MMLHFNRARRLFVRRLREWSDVLWHFWGEKWFARRVAAIGVWAGTLDLCYIWPFFLTFWDDLGLDVDDFRVEMQRVERLR